MSDTADALKRAQREVKYARKRRIYWSSRVAVIERQLRRADELHEKSARGEKLDDAEYMDAWAFASTSGRHNLVQSRETYAMLSAKYERMEGEAVRALAALQA